MSAPQVQFDPESAHFGASRSQKRLEDDRLLVGKGLFTHVAKYQAAIVIRQLTGEDGPEADYCAVPRVTFTYPEVGAVGMTEEQAREEGYDDVRCGLVDNGDSSRGSLHGVVALEAGSTLLDQFSPRREDYL